MLSRYLFSYIKAVTTRIIESLQLFNPVLTDKQLRKIACEYMERMGYGEQPYIVFKHKNISREHPHIVSMRVDEQGRKLPHDFEARRSMEILRDLERKYMPWRSYTGSDFLEGGGFWMQKPHIFINPFYYIDYALAQMGAFEFYQKMCEDKEKAWADYYRLCQSGGSRSYFNTLDYAGLSNPFHEGTVKKIMDFLETKLF